MKKIISFVLVLVLMFALAVPSFAAVTADEQATSLQSGWGSSTTSVTYPYGYSTSWFYKVAVLLREILLDTADMRDDLVSIESKSTLLYNLVNGQIKENISDSRGFLYSISESVKGFDTDLSDIVSNTSSINTSVNNLVSDIDTINLFLTNTLNGHLNDINGYLSLMKDDVSMLQQVLADEEDLAFKESQKENQALIQDTFFTPGNDLSLDTSKITEFTNQFTDFTETFDFSESVPAGSSPLDSISEGSEFSEWFTNETGLDMDPTFGGGSGGGGDGENPDPDPDPDPDPEPEPSIKNWLPLSTTEPGGSEILNGTGFLPGYYYSTSSQTVVSSASRGITGFIPCEPGDIIYLYNIPLPYSSVFFFDSNLRANILQNAMSFDGSVYYFSVPDNVNCFRINVYLEDFDLTTAVISINQYPIQTVSTFFLRSVSVEPEIVTSAYADRMAEYKNLLRGGN